MCFLTSFAYEVRGWCMIAALSDTDAHIVLSALCKANQRNGRKDKNDETSQIRGMKGPLLEQNSSYWATLALYSPGIWNPYSLFKSLF